MVDMVWIDEAESITPEMVATLDKGTRDQIPRRLRELEVLENAPVQIGPYQHFVREFFLEPVLNELCGPMGRII